MKPKLIIKLEEELGNIPIDFSEERHSMEDEMTQSEIADVAILRHDYQLSIIYGYTDPEGDYENQIWEEAYYAGYKAALAEAKSFYGINKPTKPSIDLMN